MADRMISQVKIYYQQIKEKFGETETVTLNLEVDAQIQCLLAQRSDIGKVICRKELGTFPISRAEKPLKECQVEMEEVEVIKGSDDRNIYYSGVTYLQEDQVMLADFNYNRVHLLNSSYQYISCFTLQGRPWGICVVDSHAVAVAIPVKKTIQFLYVRCGTIKSTRMVQTKYECWSVAPAGNGNIIVSGYCGYQSKYYWSLIITTGEEKCHLFDCQYDISISFTNVALNSSCTRVYVTVYNGHSLYCFDMDGRMMYKYSHANLVSPSFVAIDRDDNVYVLGDESHNIHQLESDGTPIRIIDKGINCPSAICFNNSRDKLYMFRFK